MNDDSTRTIKLLELFNFTPAQVTELESLSRDWSFLSNTSQWDAAYEIVRAYMGGRNSRAETRMIDRLGFDPFGGDVEEMISALRDRIGGAAAWRDAQRMQSARLLELLDPLGMLVNWAAKKIVHRGTGKP